jgi:hypothetical protein
MQTSSIIFWATFFTLFIVFFWLDAKYSLLRNKSTAKKKSFSYGRVQLSWWTLIIVTSFISIFISKGNLPILDGSLIILLGITSATTAAASLIDTSDHSNNPNTTLIQDEESEGFFLDILSDANGVSIHRLQALLFNVTIGSWVIYSVLKGLQTCVPTALNITCINSIIPVIDTNKLLLLGVSAATYAGLKTNENK